MRLKIGKKLKIASLNSRATGSKKDQCTSTCSLLKPIVAANINVYTDQQPQERFTSFKQLWYDKRCSFFYIDPKYRGGAKSRYTVLFFLFLTTV